MIKLIVTDLDGTLLNSHHEIPADFWALEEKLRSKNIQLAIASGRQYYNIEALFEPIKEHILILAENGTFVKQNDKELFVNEMNIDEARKFIEIGRKIPNSYMILCGKNAAYVDNPEKDFFNTVHQYMERLVVVPDLMQVEDTILKVTVCDFDNAERNSYPHFIPYINQYKVAVAGHFFIDITPMNSNKGEAVKRTQELYNIGYEETMVFGDMLNDLEMMQAAQYSFAMKNAHPQIKETAQNITEFDNNEDGVVREIQRFLNL